MREPLQCEGIHTICTWH